MVSGLFPGLFHGHFPGLTPIFWYSRKYCFNICGPNMLGNISRRTMKIKKNHENCKKIISVRKYSCERCIHSKFVGYKYKFRINRN